MEFRWISSLEKVFSDESLMASSITEATALRGERFSVQCATYYDGNDKLYGDVAVSTDLPGDVRLYRVGYVPAMLPAYPWSDDNFLRKQPGVFPDPLFEQAENISLSRKQWRSLWIEAVIPEDCPAGCYTITLTFTSKVPWLDIRESTSFTVEVLPVTLPKQTLMCTEWFHCDCLAVEYGVSVFSEAHWRIIENYVKNAADYGITMLLTPVFTPPLDTAVGGERPTVQLVDVRVEKGKYRFSFGKLKRYLDMADRCGIRYFEIAHLFTQWGAKHAPKIMATVDGEYKRIFGWDTDAISPEYTAFLRQFLKRLRLFLKKNGYLERCWFHISDEPNAEVEEGYRLARESVAEVLAGLPVMDALSNYSFYEKGLVAHPVPSLDHIDPFIENNVPDLWTYYCCGQTKDVSNRMIAMPSARNRILGVQLYKYHIVGFLQWGFNFWFSQYSHHPINPYLVTDSDDAFPSGDPFVVYPGADGRPVPSLRELVFNEGLQDMRALQLLETLTSRDEALAFIEEQCGGRPLTFKDYPREAEWLLGFREALNRKLAKLTK
ncbi:MAG: DUF4091 domain-containing protein [Clostridia bacterium]|nr:DUF4091 domain-containing protein [Clostridia bacterium]